MKRRFVALCCAALLLLSLPLFAEAVADRWGPFGPADCEYCDETTEHYFQYNDVDYCALRCSVCLWAYRYFRHSFLVNGSYLVCEYCNYAYQYMP